VQAEVLQGLRAQPGGDPPHVRRALACGLAQLLELVAELVRHVGGDPLDLQHDRREDLADLVVQLPCHPLALGLLHHERLARALAPLVLEAREHLVEGLRQTGDVRLAHHGHALPRVERVDRAHGARHGAERVERGAEQEEGHDEHEEQAAGQHQQLRRPDGDRHGHRRQHEHREDQQQHRGVRREDAPEERHVPRHPRPPRAGRARA
jgi:hypothetical protein